MSDGKRRAVTVPTGSVITVVSGAANGKGLINVIWDGRPVKMFAVDVDVRGTEIIENTESVTA